MLISFRTVAKTGCFWHPPRNSNRQEATMRIEQTSAILKQSHLERIDEQRHAPESEGWMQRAKHMIADGSSRVTSLLRNLMPGRHD
jgi:hypothetical protein